MTNNTKTIEAIRQVGGTVRIQHIRRFLKPKPRVLNLDPIVEIIEEKVTKENKVSSIEQKLGAKISPCGGVTIVEVTTPDGEKLTEKARCRENDQFNKRLGVSIALGRIIKKIHGGKASKEIKKECTGECRTCNCHSNDSQVTHNHD